MHRVVALVLPDVVAFDLSVPAQVFGHHSERGREASTTPTAYRNAVRGTAEHPGRPRSTPPAATWSRRQ